MIYHVDSSHLYAFIFTCIHDQDTVLFCVFSVFINGIMVCIVLQLAFFLARHYDLSVFTLDPVHTL